MKRLSLLLVFVFCLGGTTLAQAQTTPSSQAIAFVQSFYDWYLPIASYNVAIKRRSELFDSILLRALRNDATAQAKAVGMIDGLDWDPFLSTNGDPAPHFKAIRATGSLVTVVGFDKQPSNSLVTVMIEVRCKEDRCVIVNVLYPAHDGLKESDLLSILRELHPPKKSTP